MNDVNRCHLTNPGLKWVIINWTNTYFSGSFSHLLCKTACPCNVSLIISSSFRVWLTCAHEHILLATAYCLPFSCPLAQALPCCHLHLRPAQLNINCKEVLMSIYASARLHDTSMEEHYFAGSMNALRSKRLHR